MQAQKLATIGGGCFWCTEAVFRRVIGVSDVKSGYAGGKIDNPTYKQVCSGNTQHAEVIQFQYNPSVISYDNILRIFMNVHDPTTKDRQGADSGTQYRSIILYSDDEQKNIAYQIISEINSSKIYPNPVVTEVAPLTKFYEAEKDHQNFYNLNQSYGYCKAVIDPKLKKFLTKYKEFSQ
ncbi:hypothetical protein ABPG72_000918 [Tetrahymena utriculariae]